MTKRTEIIACLICLTAIWQISPADESRSIDIMNVPVVITSVSDVAISHYESRGPDVERREAESLPIDYRDLVRVAVENFTGLPGEPSDANNVTFLTVFEDDPDAAMMKKLADYGEEVRPGSEYTQTGVDDDAWHYTLAVIATLPTDRSTYIVELYYFCGGMCEQAWQVEVAIRDNDFVIVAEKIHWVS
jgi:hypothetical protein